MALETRICVLLCYIGKKATVSEVCEHKVSDQHRMDSTASTIVQE